MRVASLFSGVGGFEVGIRNSRLKCSFVFSSEIDKYAKASYSANFHNYNLQGDITLIKPNEIPEHDLLVAGFPCQAFSVAGKQKGFNDVRGTLIFDVIRIIQAKKPKYILLENVKNIITHDSGRTFEIIIKALNSVGYTVDFTIINSSEAGLAQSRERVYIIGVLELKSEKIINDKRNSKVNEIKRKLNYNGFSFFNSLIYNNKQKYIADILEQNSHPKYNINNNKITQYLKHNIFRKHLIYEKKIIKLFDLTREMWNDLERQRRVYSVFGISPTILARSDSAKIYIDNSEETFIRKITPRESFRLQGFDDCFIDNIINTVSDTQQYKQAGNAVSPPVITGIMNHLYSYMES